MAAEELTEAQVPLQDVLARIDELEKGKSSTAEPDDKKWGKAVKKMTKAVDALVADEAKPAGDKVKEMHVQLCEQITEAKKFERLYQQENRRYQNVEKERQSNAADLLKMTSAKTRLEGLCKELQKQQRQLSQASSSAAQEDKQKRSELSKHFNTTIADVKAKMDEQAQARTEQLEENQMLREKLQQIVAQYDSRDKLLADHHAQNDSRMKELDAQIQKQQELYQAKLTEVLKENEELKVSEGLLRARVNEYSEKFVELQNTLSKSNQMFDTFKQEMDRMQAAMKKVEKQNLELKTKNTKSEKAMLELAQERAELKKRTQQQASEMEATTKKKEALEKLCKTLQASAKASPQPADEAPVAEA